jgi:hypothetical protein
VGVKVTRELVCDLCGSNKKVARWHLQRTDGAKRSPDLCEKCAGPLEKILDVLPDKRGNRGRPVVITEAQLKAKKRAFRSRQAG